ncbi:hypothetical protein AB0I60_07615 [Actinosynnema sp. NPDC050436]|uniref:hypothetical protein n=1 Tax=Actinosynnema sp. NPDC050436 TaxID=3155659 RepID=UPI003405CACE
MHRTYPPSRVPHITAWSTETDEVPCLAIRSGRRLGYREETGQGRDERGILVKRTRSAQGQGSPVPVLASLHVREFRATELIA